MTFAETWPNADPDATGSGDDLTPPADGLHEVTLVDGGAWTAKSGVDWCRFVFQLNDGSGYKWTVLHGFKSQAQANFTKREVRALGVDVGSVDSLEAMDSAIKALAGRYFEVRVERDGTFESTYVEGAAGQGAAAAAVPAAVPAPAAGADKDIPF